MGMSEQGHLAFGVLLGSKEDAEDGPEFFSGGLWGGLLDEEQIAERETGETEYVSQRDWLEEQPWELLSFGHIDYPFLFLAARGTERVSYRGEPVRLPDSIENGAESQKLIAFAGWVSEWAPELRGKLGWHFFASYG